MDFGEAGAYQLRQRLNTKGHRDKGAWAVSLRAVDFIFSPSLSRLPPTARLIVIDQEEGTRLVTPKLARPLVNDASEVHVEAVS